MKINELEKDLNISRANIRFYEKEGLLNPIRKDNGYRDYKDDDIARLKLIIIFRKLGISVSDIKEILNGQLALQDAVKRNIDVLEKNIDALSGAINLCDEIVEENIELKDFSEDYYWGLINKREKDGWDFKNINDGYFKKHNITNLILLTIVCIAPFLHIVFDYFILEKQPEIKTVILAIVCMCFPISFFILFYRILKIK